MGVVALSHLTAPCGTLCRTEPRDPSITIVPVPRGDNLLTAHDFHPTPESPEPERLDEDQQSLEPVRQALRVDGFWAYGTIDEQNRWSVAIDDELGRVDVRIGKDGYELELRASSPGLYADDESPWRRQARCRLARLQIPRIARGFLGEHQHASWDEVEEGVAVSETVELPFQRRDDIPTFIRTRLPELESLVAEIERQLG